MKCYKHYGGRGIHVCSRWENFLNFFEDMGKRPSPNLELDRIDNELGYFPDNCHWATRLEQNNNTRRVVRINGLSLSENSRITGLPIDTIRHQLKKGLDPLAKRKAFTGQKLNEQSVKEIRALCASGEMQKNVAAKFGVRRDVISNIVHRRLWKHVA